MAIWSFPRTQRSIAAFGKGKTMVFGMSLPTYTALHTILSLIGIASEIVSLPCGNSILSAQASREY